MPKIKLVLGDVRALSRKELKRYPEYKYVVCEACTCYYDDKIITVPVGFLTDGSSGGPDVGWSWLFHDWLYTVKKYDDGTDCTRHEADRIMYYLLKNERHRMYAFLYKIVIKLCSCFFESSWNNDDNLDMLSDDDYDH